MENKIAVVLCGLEKEKKLKEVFSDVKWVEVRIDMFLKIFPEEKLIPYLKKTRENFHGNIIGTVRWFKEQDKEKTYIKETKRREIYEKIIPYVDYLDIEIKSRLAPKIVKISKSKNRKTILSYHNFKKIPSVKKLKSLYQKAELLNPDIFKLAVQINKTSEFLSLMNLAIKWKQTVLIVPMGMPGIFRFIPLYYGSPFTYVFLEKPSASGQFSYETFNSYKKLKDFY
ncbi:MAG: type I 3-dehydroquinate dehydratase [Candidatus Omnitrophica bacterium]|nr:type I 3-dehydroquinate dehydratase [Candidatus Omnitrophota bacterium]